MDSYKRNKIIYWVLTLVLVIPTAGSGVLELFTNGPEAVVKSMQVLGYPLYLMKILGFAKILAGLAMITNHFPKLKEWAYAGLAIDFLGAVASHILAGDAVNAPPAAVMFVLLMGSYYFWNKTKERRV